MSEIKVDTVGPRVDNGTLTIGAAGDTVNIAGTAGTGFPAGTTINTNADNRVITGSGTAGTLNGETNFIYNGTLVGAGATGASADLGNGVHVRTSDSGATVNANFDEFVAESSGNAGLSILAATDGYAGICFGDSGDNQIGSVIYYHGDNSMQINTSASVGIKIHSNQVISPPAGIALGVGSANTASHVLDDYEEGTFVPTWSVQGGGSLGTAPATNKGVYTKVGRSCTISIMSYILATTGTLSSYTCTNLPFQSAPFTVAPSMGQEFGQTGNGMLCVVGQDDSTVVIKKYDGNAPPANAYMRVCFTYQTV